MQVKTINISGKLYPIAYPMSALSQFEELTGESYQSFFSDLTNGIMNPKKIANMYFAGLSAGARLKSQEPPAIEFVSDNLSIRDFTFLVPILTEYLPKSEEETSEGNATGEPSPSQ